MTRPGRLQRVAVGGKAAAAQARPKFFNASLTDAAKYDGPLSDKRFVKIGSP